MTPTRHPEINVTPLVDVLLVLLIIFLTTLPLSQPSLDASLPAATAYGSTETTPSVVVLEYARDGAITVNRQRVNLGALEERLRDIFAARRDKTLYIIGDEAVAYREIIAVMDRAKGAGVTRLGVVTPAMRRAAGGA